jgi:hypothetical protein
MCAVKPARMRCHIRKDYVGKLVDEGGRRRMSVGYSRRTYSHERHGFLFFTNVLDVSACGLSIDECVRRAWRGLYSGGDRGFCKTEIHILSVCATHTHTHIRTSVVTSMRARRERTHDLFFFLFCFRLFMSLPDVQKNAKAKVDCT